MYDSTKSLVIPGARVINFNSGMVYDSTKSLVIPGASPQSLRVSRCMIVQNFWLFQGLSLCN